MIRYRTGVHPRTGQILRGRAHMEACVWRILTTQLEERVMLLAFGSDLMRHIGRNLVPPIVARIYRNAVVAIHTWEPEYRVSDVQLIDLDGTGRLALGTVGTYFPEGRFGNFRISEPANAAIPLQAQEVLGREALAS